MTDADKVADKINKIIYDLQHKRLSQLNSSNISKLWTAVRSVSDKVGLSQPDLLFSLPIDEINQFFAKISTTDAYDISDIETLYNDIPNVHINDEITPIVVEKMLRTMKSTSAGYDDIQAWVFKTCSYELADIVTFIVYRSIELGQVPSNWQKSIVTPIAKTSNPRSIAEYRPISVTPTLSRLTEQLVVARYLRPSMFAETLRDQFAYKPTGSTACALIKTIHHITEAFNTGSKYVRVLLIDFSKAFDTVDHQIIIRKINQLDLPPNVKNWLISFLVNRIQITKVNGKFSGSARINRGVVQGSALGLFLFMLLISDLCPVSILNSYVKYADDLTIIVPELSNTGLDI